MVKVKFGDYYKVVHDSIGDITLKVFYKNKRNEEEILIAESDFYVKSLPYPQPQISGKLPGIINKEFFKKGLILEIKLPTSYIFPIKYEVISFNIGIRTDGELRKYPSNKDHLTDMQVGKILNSETGSVIYLCDIKARHKNVENSHAFKLLDFAYVLK